MSPSYRRGRLNVPASRYSLATAYKPTDDAWLRQSNQSPNKAKVVVETSHQNIQVSHLRKYLKYVICCVTALQKPRVFNASTVCRQFTTTRTNWQKEENTQKVKSSIHTIQCDTASTSSCDYVPQPYRSLKS